MLNQFHTVLAELTFEILEPNASCLIEEKAFVYKSIRIQPRKCTDDFLKSTYVDKVISMRASLKLPQKKLAVLLLSR